MSTKQLQLFILPYAGGSAASFAKFARLIDKRVEVITVEYPGRGARAQEAFASSITDLLFDVARFINARRVDNVPFCIMGYSMGSILAYELLSKNLIPGNTQHLFICAEVSPKERALDLQRVSELTESLILQRVRNLGGFDERLLDNQRFRKIYVDPMIADYKLFYGYRFENNYKILEANTTFFYCEDDTSLSDVQKWSALIDGVFDFYNLGDNHFFINKYYSEMANIVNYHINRLI